MKTTIKRLMLSAMMIVMATTAFAQDDNNGRKRITREQLAEQQAKHIANKLAFDSETTSKFVAAYTEYHKELWAMGPKAKQRAKENKEQKAAAEGETAGKVKKQMERSKKLMALKEKYYSKYAEFLTDKQIDRVYEIERNQMRKLSMKRKGNFRRDMKRGGMKNIRKPRHNRR